MSKKTSKKPTKSTNQPRVYKKNELKLMVEMVEAGLWRTSNLQRVLGLDRTTIKKYKGLPVVKDAYRKTVSKYLKLRKDEEKVLKELKIESDNEVVEHKIDGLIIVRSDGNKT